ncbi:MAG: hypothetical protein ACRDHW_12690 [Ktedonobacteraceae bacterium]
MKNQHLYPQHWKQISRKCREDAGWMCEFCHIAQGAERVSRRGNIYKVSLQACHENHRERRNPHAKLLCLCAICHWWMDFEQDQLELWRKLERLKHRRLLTPQRIALARVRALQRAQPEPVLLGA